MTIMAARPTGIPRLDLGPESGDHLSIRVLPGTRTRVGTDAGRLVCPVHVHVGGFSGDVAAVLRPEELHRFGEPGTGIRLRFRLERLDAAQMDAWIDACAAVDTMVTAA